jgi:hypothetical protein
MVFHIVLFRPKPALPASEEESLMAALVDAASGIPTVRQFRVGRRIVHGSQYEQMMRDDFPFCAVVEFDDLEGLQAYLAHPQHEKLGALFYQLQEAALAYDYAVGSVTKSRPTTA